MMATGVPHGARLDAGLGAALASMAGPGHAVAALQRPGLTVIAVVAPDRGTLLHDTGDGLGVDRDGADAVATAFGAFVDAAAAPTGELPPADASGAELAAATVTDVRWRELLDGEPPTTHDAPIVVRAARAAAARGTADLTVVGTGEGGVQHGHQVAWTVDALGWVRLETSDMVDGDGAVDLVVSPWPGAIGALQTLLAPLRPLRAPTHDA